MLQSVSIQNFAIIDDLTVDFSSGMSVLTGETGAGKSIIIDAVSLLAGSRGSSAFIRHGSEKAVLQALFDIENAPLVQTLMQELSIPNEDNQLMVYRELHSNGKSVVRLNGLLSNVSVLKQLAQQLIDIHGQHEHQQLMDDKYHLSLLDSFSPITITPLLQDYRNYYTHYQQAKKSLKSLMLSQTQDDQKVVMLKQHIKDIETVQPKANEVDELTLELKEMTLHETYAKIVSAVDVAFHSEEHGVLEQLQKVLSQLQSVEDKTYQEQASLVMDVLEMLKETAKFATTELEKHQFDVARYEYIQARLSQYDTLTEKYGDVLAYYEEAKADLDKIVNKDVHLVQAQESFVMARQNVLNAGMLLSQERQKQAELLAEKIHEQLADLYMDKVVFKVNFEVFDKPKITINGLDNVSFMVATNSGEPLKPLAKVASGGELSRLMLALKVIFSKQQGIGTLIFDEIDTGVSGRVAHAIAQKMATIGHFAQVLCVTHLPQVAAVAKQHLFVSKHVVDNHTQTQITRLSMNEREQEVAKMFAGDVLNDSALAHARELLNSNHK